MNTYFDTSALAKKYVREPGSDEIIKLWRASTAVFTSAVTYAQMMASLHRKRREVVVPAKTFERLLASFRELADLLLRRGLGESSPSDR